MSNDFTPDIDNQSLIVIDGNHLARRSFHKLRDLHTQSGEPTGALFGYCRSMGRICKTFPAEEFSIVVVFDGYYHRKTDPRFLELGYKGNRKIPSDFRHQIKEIRKATKYMGIPSIMLKQFEADHIIAVIVKDISKKLGYKNSVIVSSDKDFYQLLDININVYDDLKDRVITMFDFSKEYGINPERFALVKALAGDPSDNLKGIKGVGIKRAVNIIKSSSNINKALKEMGIDQYVASRILKEYSLIKLPTKAARLLNANQIAFLEDRIKNRPKQDPAKLLKMFRRYEMGSLMTNFTGLLKSFADHQY